MEHLFDMRPDRPGYRLHRLEIFNWGTFDSSDGHVYRFEPQGRTSLLVGQNGSGKSTLVDAILTLLVDSRTRNYNVAAGAKKTERTAKSYIRGAFDRTADDSQTSVIKYLRPTATHLTAISAVFRDEQLGKAFTLSQVLYLTADGSDDKVYAIADESRELKDDLAGLRKSDEIRNHLGRLGYQTTKTYVEYHGWLTKRTQMRSKAMGMFNQTVAVKDIQSLNDFIRRHMLEAHNWRDKVQGLLTHFNDLNIAHQELVRARRAEELLSPVEKLGAKYRQHAEELEQLEQQLAASSTYFPMQVIQLFEPEITLQQANVDAMSTTIHRLEGEIKSKREVTRQLANEIDRAGGERLKQIPSLIELEAARLANKQETFGRFHEHLKTCQISAVVSDPESLEKTRQQLRQAAKHSEEKIATLKIDYEEAIGAKASIERQLSDERSELAALEGRRSNLPARFTAMRANICRDLNLNESALPFAAELIAVSSAEHGWEASAEMVLRSFALSLLVPDMFYRRVRAYVEANRITDVRGEGQRLDYLCVGKATEPGGDRIDPQSLFSKLQFKPRHDLSPWVHGEILRRFDFHCCQSVEEFNEATRMAITRNRHVKFNSQRHQKDDRARAVDPRHFILGWDNTEKKRRIAEHIRQLETERETLGNSVADFSRQIEDGKTLHRAALAAFEITDFDAIDVKRHETEIAALRKEQRDLEESNDAVKSLRKRLKAAEAEEQKLSDHRDGQLQQKAKLEDEIQRVKRMVQTAQDDVQAAKDAGNFQRHEHMFNAIADSLGETPVSTADLFQRQKQWESATRQRTERLRKPLQELSDKLVSAMTRFLREFREEQTDLNASVKSLDSFFGLLDQIRREDLPRHEKKFKQRLNDQVSQEVAVLNTALRLERKHIVDKIDLLNKALAELEYQPGTFMRLEPRQVQDREIDDFRRSLRECLDEAFEHTDEANEARFVRIQKFVERLGDKEKTTWRNKVIDVRNWYDFAAREVVRETQATKSYYDGSSGQSGGEKAKLAFTILVAAIAYQFDIDPTGNAPGRFQFVMVDEMFSKVDDQNAKYALKLFKQFGLQLLIVAPLDPKARVAEPFVDRYLHVVKDPDTHHSKLYSMTAREYEEVVQGFTANGSSTTQRAVTAR